MLFARLRKFLKLTKSDIPAPTLPTKQHPTSDTTTTEKTIVR